MSTVKEWLLWLFDGPEPFVEEGSVTNKCLHQFVKECHQENADYCNCRKKKDRG